MLLLPQLSSPVQTRSILHTHIRSFSARIPCGRSLRRPINKTPLSHVPCFFFLSVHFSSLSISLLYPFLFSIHFSSHTSPSPSLIPCQPRCMYSALISC